MKQYTSKHLGAALAQSQGDTRGLLHHAELELVQEDGATEWV